jgi:HSP20 family protein
MAGNAFRLQPLFLPAVAAREVEWQPPVDVYRAPNGWLVKFDLAGVRPQDLEWSVGGTILTVRGMRRDCLLEEGCSHYRMEIAYSKFERRIEFPGDLSAARISTEYRDGMLIVRITWERAS